MGRLGSSKVTGVSGGARGMRKCMGVIVMSEQPERDDPGRVQHPGFNAKNPDAAWYQTHQATSIKCRNDCLVCGGALDSGTTQRPSGNERRGIPEDPGMALGDSATARRETERGTKNRLAGAETPGHREKQIYRLKFYLRCSTQTQAQIQPERERE